MSENDGLILYKAYIFLFIEFRWEIHLDGRFRWMAQMYP